MKYDQTEQDEDDDGTGMGGRVVRHLVSPRPLELNLEGRVERGIFAWVMPALDAIFLYEIWYTAQQAYICTWGHCPSPKIWSHACVAAGVGGVYL